MWILFAIGSSFFAGITASVVVPIDKLSILVTIAFSWIVFHEKLSRKAAVGVVLSTLGTVVMTMV